MAGFRISNFSGLVPRLAKQLLAPNQAQVATNCNLTSGDVRPRNGTRLVYAPVVNSDIKSMFRMEKDGNERWLTWDKDIDVARSPIAGNTERRFYYTGDGEPRTSDFDTAASGAGPFPSNCFVLGVTPPVTAPTVAPSGGTGADVTRSYVYTFVTPWGEESAPSPASALATGKESGSTWALSGMDAAPPNSGTITGVLPNAPTAGYVEITLDTVYGLRAGETLMFEDTGMSDLDSTFTLESVDSATKKVVITLSTTQTYTSGGTWERGAPHNTAGMTKRIYRTLTSSSGTEYHYVVTVAAATTTYSDTASDEAVGLGEVLPSATKKVVITLSTTQTYTSGGTWERGAPHNTAGMTKRIYRTLTSSSGTEYHYVVTVAAATTTYSDTASDEAVGLGEVLPSAKWAMPPATMRGIVIMANGIACGFFGNEVCFSEPFRPYAWPIAYRQTYDQDIVAIGVTGTTLVGMTQGNPFTITGVEPVTMGGGMQKLGVAWPCMSKRGVASFPFGVGYPAPQGLVIIGVQSDIVTKDLFTQKEWANLNPNTFVAATADNRYYAGYYANDKDQMFVIDKTETAAFIEINQGITGIWSDPLTGKLYIAVDKKIYEWEGDPGTKLNYEWKSKQFLTASPLNYGAVKIDADFEMTETEQFGAADAVAAIIASNKVLMTSGAIDDGLADGALGEYEIGGDAMQALPPLSIDSLQFQFWANGRLMLTKQVVNTRAFRLPSGYKADNVEIVISGNVKVSAVVLAETMDGLRQV